MSTEFLFDITFYLAVPFWALMIFAPTWRGTARVMSTPWVAAVPLVVYFVLALPHLGQLWDVVSRPNLGTLIDFVGEPYGAAAIWAQIISFDLFIGRWIHLEARELGLHPLVVGPILVLTILLSPFALVVFLALRTVAAKRKLDAVGPAPATA
ncbi:ABA4-like family protein [Umezawaea endophytica]|uniref:ABA4-like family protein n=1 Tax=Umezawaea endophytica TaxID=1654476 RepID=A0A9X2VUF5_9PSEU|nr:ABA4-like family protein [Umezawaea endophytica]MCS7482407.1 ABA4-like family protein [Umezawaea endophytica]